MVYKLYEEYIKGTAKEATVVNKKIMACRLTGQVNEIILRECGVNRIYISSRCLKHMYDERPAEEFEFILSNIQDILKLPDFIYKNRESKRGDWCLVKKIEDDYYLASVGMEGQGELCLEVATIFRLKKFSYLKKYDALWSWEDGVPPS